MIPKLRARARKRHHGGRTQCLILERQKGHAVPEPGEARGVGCKVGDSLPNKEREWVGDNSSREQARREVVDNRNLKSKGQQMPRVL